MNDIKNIIYLNNKTGRELKFFSPPIGHIPRKGDVVIAYDRKPWIVTLVVWDSYMSKVNNVVQHEVRIHVKLSNGLRIGKAAY